MFACDSHKIAAAVESTPVAYVILSADVTADGSVRELEAMRPAVGEWVKTEGDEGYEWDYLADEFGDERFRGGMHRKWVAELSFPQFAAFLNEAFGLTIEEAREEGEPTGGSLTEFGWLPAYALSCSPMDWNVGGVTDVIEFQAYVTDVVFFSGGEEGS